MFKLVWCDDSLDSALDIIAELEIVLLVALPFPCIAVIWIHISLVCCF